jgi:hypothetical protein
MNHGIGRIEFVEGNVYEGAFRKGKMHGIGTLWNRRYGWMDGWMD